MGATHAGGPGLHLSVRQAIEPCPPRPEESSWALQKVSQAAGCKMDHGRQGSKQRQELGGWGSRSGQNDGLTSETKTGNEKRKGVKGRKAQYGS